MVGSVVTQANNLKSGKFDDLRRRLLFLLLALVVFRIGVHIPVPGINPDVVKGFFSPDNAGSGLLGMANMFTGGAMERASILALGIMPYISASIVMQLMTHVVPSLEAIKKEGESGKRKITQYTRYGALALALFQGYMIATGIASSGAFYNDTLAIRATTALTLASGTMFLMWLGEQITERGLGNGISLIIFSGIVANLPSAVYGVLSAINIGTMAMHVGLIVFLVVVFVTYFVVFVERGQRKILVNYARRQQGNKMVGGQTSFLPLKLNMAGVIPPIFASSIMMFPQMLGASAIAPDTWYGRLLTMFTNTDQPGYMLLLAIAIIGFCFFYTALVFNSRETADNLKRSGAFIPGYRPGEQTSRYIDKVLTRLTLIGSIYITLVCLLPLFLQSSYNVSFYFGGTSLLIIVVVTMDFWAQVQNYMVSHQYESLLKRVNLKK